MKHFGLLLFLFLLTCGCEAVVEPQAEPVPVIEAWIDSDGYPKAKFTSAISPTVSGGELIDNMVRWGKVTISDGEKEVVMTAKRDNSYFPPYIYFSYDMIGTPGRTYTLKATYKKMQASAEVLMYKPVDIDNITFQAYEGSDTLRSAMLHFTAPSDTPAYFYLTIDGMPALMGWAEAVEPGVKMSVPVCNSKQTSEGEKFVAQLRVGSSHLLALHRVSREVYDFWRAYDDVAMFSQNILLGGASSLPGNINGGLGVFSVRGTSYKQIVVP